MSWLYLASAGFLLGSFLRTGWHTTRYEPEVRVGYGIVGVGIALSVVVNTALVFAHEEADAWRVATLVAYAIVALGLVVIVRQRRGR